MSNAHRRHARLLACISLAALWMACVRLGAADPQAAPQREPHAGVELQPVPSRAGYETATAPGALQVACSAEIPALESFFAARDVPFVARLVKKQGRQSCHVFYEPTTAGFRVTPENFAVKELFFDVETLSFLALRSERFGDALDITKTILEKASRPLDVTIGVALTQDHELYSRALAFHFPKSRHRIRLRNYAVESSNPWVQDYLKAGHAGGKERILVTRRLFEGRATDGDLFRPMLDQLNEERFVRSKLSWEGGDLQFVADPGDPARTILFYGDSARGYWGDSLSGAEYEYVLRLEFGADDAVDLTKLAPHVDYFVAFLARENIALVSQPVTENYDVIRSALDILIKHYDSAVPAELTALSSLFSDRQRAFVDELGAVRKLVDRAKKNSPDWPKIEDGPLAYELGEYVTSNCSEAPDECLIGSSLGRLLHTNLPLARRWFSEALRSRTHDQLVPRLLSVIESQLPGFRIETQNGIDAAVASLEKLGFRVVRVPRMGGDRALAVPWSGISYANAVLIDKQFFVPEFGLGQPEQKFFDDLRAKLPSGYEVVPVYARHMMLFNGGTHCVLAIVRDVPGKTP
jgi:hypothetical protein